MQQSIMEIILDIFFKRETLKTKRPTQKEHFPVFYLDYGNCGQKINFRFLV